MADEDPAEYDRQFQLLEQNIFSKNAIEFALVRQIADAEWRLRRVARIEAGLVSHQHAYTNRDTRKWAPDTILPDRDGKNQLLGKSMADRTQALANLARYHTHMSRNQLRALNMIGKLRAEEARYRENIDPKTGAIHRPSVTDPDPYNTPDGPLPTRYEPPAAVAQAPSRPIGFRPNPHSTVGVERCCSQCRGTACRARLPGQAQNLGVSSGLDDNTSLPARAARSSTLPPIGSWSAYEPLGPTHESRNTNHEARLTGPSTSGRVAGTKRTQSRRSYLESMGWHRVPSAAPLHEGPSSRSAALLGLKPVGGMTLTASRARRPCLRPFCEERALPSSVRGPVDFLAFCRFAFRCASVAMRFPLCKQKAARLARAAR